MNQFDSRFARANLVFVDDVLLARVECCARLHPVFTYVEATPYDAITLADAAVLAKMERSSFSRYFKVKTGVAFLTFVRMCKISHAVAVLEASNGTISETASRLGFKCVGTFVRAFRLVTGATPSAFRERSREAYRRAPGDAG